MGSTSAPPPNRIWASLVRVKEKEKKGERERGGKGRKGGRRGEGSRGERRGKSERERGSGYATWSSGLWLSLLLVTIKLLHFMTI